ncbi:MAG: radical SAM protein [Desulfobacteraceae bacterium]|nr:radical SAM protein [Desulfobacteraceae bacterium]
MDNPLVIPVFIPHSGCPHQCAFCNQSIITSQANPLPSSREIDEIIGQYLGYKADRSRVELAFFGGNFLGLPDRDIVCLLEKIRPYIENQTIHGIRCSTRPDTITEQKLDLIAPYGVSLVELGVQSMTDVVLKRANRGHNSFQTRVAVSLLKARQIQVGVQVMTGLPGDTKDQLLHSTRQVASLEPDIARIYPLMVLKGSLLAQWYKEGSYIPLGLDQSVHLVKEMFKIFEQANVRVVRMGLQASEMMEDKTLVLAGPWHPAFGHLVLSVLVYDQVCEKLAIFLKLFREDRVQHLLLGVHPRFESRLRGDKNSNLEKLGNAYPEIIFSVQTNDRLMHGEVDIKKGVL